MGRPAGLPEVVSSVHGRKQRRCRRRRDVIFDGGDDVRGGGRGCRGGVVMTQRVRVVFERDAHRPPVLHRRHPGHIAWGGRDVAADVERLTIN